VSDAYYDPDRERTGDMAVTRREYYGANFNATDTYLEALCEWAGTQIGELVHQRQADHVVRRIAPWLSMLEVAFRNSDDYERALDAEVDDAEAADIADAAERAAEHQAELDAIHDGDA